MTKKYVSNPLTGAKVYHTDLDCQYLNDDYREASDRLIHQRGFDECSACSGDVEHSHSKDLYFKVKGLEE